MIEFRTVRRIAVRWAQSHNLDLKSDTNFPFHDYLHARLGCGIHEEGLVLATELLIGYKLPYLEHFYATAQFMTTAYGLDATDKFDKNRADQVLARALHLLPEFRSAEKKVPPGLDRNPMVLKV